MVDQRELYSETTPSLGALINGDMSLARAFWFYHVLIANLVIGFGLGFLFGPSLITLTITLIIQTCVTIGVWRSAFRHTGLKLWAILACLLNGAALTLDLWLLDVVAIGHA